MLFRSPLAWQSARFLSFSSIPLSLHPSVPRLTELDLSLYPPPPFFFLPTSAGLSVCLSVCLAKNEIKVPLWAVSPQPGKGQAQQRPEIFDSQSLPLPRDRPVCVDVSSKNKTDTLAPGSTHTPAHTLCLGAEQKDNLKHTTASVSTHSDSACRLDRHTHARPPAECTHSRTREHKRAHAHVSTHKHADTWVSALKHTRAQSNTHKHSQTHTHNAPKWRRVEQVAPRAVVGPGGLQGLCFPNQEPADKDRKWNPST